jgi:hypothetical protein
MPKKTLGTSEKIAITDKQKAKLLVDIQILIDYLKPIVDALL